MANPKKSLTTRSTMLALFKSSERRMITMKKSSPKTTAVITRHTIRK